MNFVTKYATPRKTEPHSTHLPAELASHFFHRFATVLRKYKPHSAHAERARRLPAPHALHVIYRPSRHSAHDCVPDGLLAPHFVQTKRPAPASHGASKFKKCRFMPHPEFVSLAPITSSTPRRFKHDVPATLAD